MIAVTSPLRGWCGKEIGQSGEVRNLVRRGGAIKKSVAAVGPIWLICSGKGYSTPDEITRWLREAFQRTELCCVMLGVDLALGH